MQKTVLLLWQSGLFCSQNPKSRRRTITLKKTREELQKELDEAAAKLEQYRHRQQRLENRINDIKEVQRRKRNHRLITRGADMESVVPAVQNMSQTSFRLLVEEVFSLPEVAALVNRVPKELDAADGAEVCAARRAIDQQEDE